MESDMACEKPGGKAANAQPTAVHQRNPETRVVSRRLPERLAKTGAHKTQCINVTNGTEDKTRSQKQ
jgi:hypothetical protein